MKHFLLVIDLQKGFIREGVNSYVEDRISKLCDTKAFDCVVTSIYKNYEGSPISRLMGWNKLMTKAEQEVCEGFKDKYDYSFTKTTYSAYCDELIGILKSQNGGELPEAVFLAGVDTECCVLMTATELFEAGIRPILLADYCGAAGGVETHNAGLRSMESLIGTNNMYYGEITSRADLDGLIATASENNHSPSDSLNLKATRLTELLKAKGYRISFAESCTGGLAAAGLVSVASASAVFDSSFVTYSNESKLKYLGVNNEDIQKLGVVSEKVAISMAIGAARQNNAQVAVGISGIAGPTGGTAQKPVGTVCFGFYLNGETFSATCNFGSIGRNKVRNASVEFVYNTLIEKLS